MGIDIEAINFFAKASAQKPFERTITIGRQGLFLPKRLLQQLVTDTRKFRNQVFCEELLVRHLNATEVHSIDNSDYESATHIHDFNQPLPAPLCQQYDTVIDAGSLEHIYNIPQALKNCSLLCKPGGQILHILPANNFCGHGFWQFSPELFFSLYSEGNGYSQTEVYICGQGDWYRVKPPKNGKRVDLTSKIAFNVVVRTVLNDASFSHDNVQQSDYVFEWDQSSPEAAAPAKTGLRQQIKKIPYAFEILSPIYDGLMRLKTSSGLNSRNPGIEKISLPAFVAKSTA
jgi:SAM-dependent methyltransferase